LEILDLPGGMHYTCGLMEEMAEQFGVHALCEAHKDYEDSVGKYVSTHLHTLLTIIKMISVRSVIGVNLQMSSYSLSSGLHIPT